MKNTLILSTIFTSLVLSFSNPRAEITDQVKQVHAVEIQNEQFIFRIRTFGVLSPNVEEMSFRKSGRIKRFLVDEGDRVEKDQLLAELDTDDANEQLNKQRLELDSAQKAYSRLAKLQKDGFVKLSAMEEAKERLDRSQIDFDQAELNVKRSRLTAPSAGVILKQSIESRTSVSPGQVIYVFLSDDEPWITKVNLTDRNTFRINPSAAAALRFSPYPNTLFAGEVSKLAQVANFSDGLYTAEIKVIDDGLELRAGMVAEVDLFTRSEASYSMIPFEALLDVRQDQANIYLVSDDGNSAIQQEVTIFDISGDRVAIVEPLEGLVITRGNQSLSNNSVIQVKQ